MRKLFRFFNQWVVWVEISRTFGTQFSHKMQQSCRWWLKNPPVLCDVIVEHKKSYDVPSYLLFIQYWFVTRFTVNHTRELISQSHKTTSTEAESWRDAGGPGKLTLIQLQLIILSVIINCRRIKSRKCWKCEFNLTLGGCWEDRIQYQLLFTMFVMSRGFDIIGIQPSGWLISDNIGLWELWYFWFLI